MYCSQKLGEDFAKFCGLLRIYELYISYQLIKHLKFVKMTLMILKIHTDYRYLSFTKFSFEKTGIADDW